jgi:plastocyanin
MPRLAHAAACLAGAFALFDAHAAAVTANVVDKAGRPVAGAVVVLEPIGARPPVKPMSGVEISQAKRTFMPDVTVVTVGTPVTFPNLDTVRHQVYSFSPAKTFELKLYAGTPSTPVVFDKPGVVVLGCNIHDLMSAWVVVVDTPYHARSGDGGKARFDGVPAGSYRMRAWHRGLDADAAWASANVTVAGVDLDATIRVEGVAPASP